MKSLFILFTAALLTSQLIAQPIQPGVRSTFHAVDENGKPIRDEIIEVEVTFAKADAQGNKVPIYVERFQEKTTTDGYFQRQIGNTTGDLPTIVFGKYDDVDFTDPGLCVRVNFRRTEIFNPQWIEGSYSMMNPVPVAARSLDSGDPDDADKDATNELQEINKNGNSVSLSKGGGNVVLNDDDPTNELQALSYDPDTKVLTLEGGSTVDLSGLQQFMDNGTQLCTAKDVQAKRFTTKDGRTDIEGGKISFRYDNGIQSDGIEMGVDDQTGYPFISFVDSEGNTLGSFRMGPQGFKYYEN